MSLRDILWLIIVVLAVSTLLFHVAHAEVIHEDESCTESHLAMVESCWEVPAQPDPIPSPGPAPRTKVA